jgi:hypothetical protein
MKNKVNCTIVSIIIGREFSIDKLLDYFSNLSIPNQINQLNLNLVLGCNSNFTKQLKSKIKELKLSDKYNKISFIEGNRRCHPDLNWEEWEQYTRKKDTLVKHDSALQNINIGLQSVEEGDFIHFVDDDTIPPYFALKDLFNAYNKIENCGIASGIYFNKEWLGPTIITEKPETKRRIVASVRKDKWVETSIDDLTYTDYTDIGFVGNGCMLLSVNDTKQILPLTENRDYFDTDAPPDSKICHRIRLLGKKISVVPSIVCKHLDDKGEPVGLSEKYLEKIKNSGKPKKILFMNFNPYINYLKLTSEYDYTIITAFTELINSNHKNKLKTLTNFSNIKLVKKSIVDVVNKYSLDFKIKHEFNMLLTFQEIYSYISDKSEYKIYAYRNSKNDINLVATLDSSKLKNLLNTKI